MVIIIFIIKYLDCIVFIFVFTGIHACVTSLSSRVALNNK